MAVGIHQPLNLPGGVFGCFLKLVVPRKNNPKNDGFLVGKLTMGFVVGVSPSIFRKHPYHYHYHIVFFKTTLKMDG